MPPLIQWKPAYLAISAVLSIGWPRSGNVVSTPILSRKSALLTAVVAAPSATGSVVRAWSARACAWSHAQRWLIDGQRRATQHASYGKNESATHESSPCHTDPAHCTDSPMTDASPQADDGRVGAEFPSGQRQRGIVAGTKAGGALPYGLGQGATMVGAFWGVFAWKELRPPGGHGETVGGDFRQTARCTIRRQFTWPTPARGP